jgi:hypothetical protein
MSIHELVPVLQLSVSPVIVISGVGLVLLSMVNRYGHIVDMTRGLSRELRKSGDDNSGHLHAQLRIMYSRARRVRTAIFLACLSVLLAAVLICVLFLICLLQLEAAVVIVALFVSCMVALSASLIVFLTDINMSLNALSLEFDSHSPSECDSVNRGSRSKLRGIFGGTTSRSSADAQERVPPAPPKPNQALGN